MQFLNYLSGLFQNPIKAWQSIGRNHFGSSFSIVSKVYLPFYLIMPVMVGIDYLFHQNFVLSKFVYSVVLLPFIYLTAYLIVLYLLSIIIEEAGQYLGAKISPLIGTKIAFFSSLPLLSFSLFYSIPYLNKAAFIIGLTYKIILIFMAGKHLMLLPSKKSIIWMMAIAFTFAMLITLFTILASLLALFMHT